MSLLRAAVEPSMQDADAVFAREPFVAQQRVGPQTRMSALISRVPFPLRVSVITAIATMGLLLATRSPLVVVHVCTKDPKDPRRTVCKAKIRWKRLLVLSLVASCAVHVVVYMLRRSSRGARV